MKSSRMMAGSAGFADPAKTDGETLLDLLVEYEIGVTKRQATYWESAAEKLVQFEGEGEGATP